MFTIECIIKNKNNKVFSYKAVAIPRIQETIVFHNCIYQVIGVIHYTDNIHKISLLVEVK